SVRPLTLTARTPRRSSPLHVVTAIQPKGYMRRGDLACYCVFVVRAAEPKAKKRQESRLRDHDTLKGRGKRMQFSVHETGVAKHALVFGEGVGVSAWSRPKHHQAE